MKIRRGKFVFYFYLFYDGGGCALFLFCSKADGFGNGVFS